MEVAAARGAGSGGGGGGSGGGGPAPFLLKTYEMVDDPSSDAVVSWSDASDGSFVVWNPPEFAARMLPTYFKHNNFSSFIRQLNTYGFRKIDPERWEFANEYFVKGQKHLLKNIHRRKPIHSHGHQPGALPDNERALFEDEIDRLSREKAAVEADLWKFNQQQSGAVSQIEDLERRVLDMEQRQTKMLSFLQQAQKNPHTSRQEMGNLLNQHFSDKLKLGLCPATTENNLITLSTQSSHEDNGSPHGKHPDYERTGMECLPLVPQMMERSDTGTSICPSKSVSFTTAAANDDGFLPCHLNLSLASCSMDVGRSQIPVANGNTVDEKDGPAEVTTPTMEKDGGIPDRCHDDTQNEASGDPGAAAGADAMGRPHGGSQAPPPEEHAAPQVVANDKFWEQFLTERPGCSESEEASSTLRRDPDHTQQAYEGTTSDRRDMGQLKL
ncbi:unnamed protein product [Miscanthus lutarioriparius]|uniref:HSF-type DNA-binding domain-containing protein n=1 Tax=Miscanthus lutarioriparius TaxID=422564 RepID=A0A811PYH4_9POAL|nr:unnamed protein product [Miscanthus lutarioriparius]